MSKSTILASARITAADDIITIQLVEPADTPPAIFIRWPRDATVTTPDRLPAAANKVMAVLAEAIAKLGQIRSGEL